MSLEQLFTSAYNVNYVSGILGVDARVAMEQYAKTARLDDYESVTHSIEESLNFVNTGFIKNNNKKITGRNLANGNKYPTFSIDSINTDDPYSYRSFDAQYVPDVFVSNSNFRYNNQIKSWVTGPHKRNYDRDDLGSLLDRELSNINRGHDMSSIYGENEYKSSQN